MDKSEIRREMKRRNLSLSPSTRAALSQRLLDRVAATEAFAGAQVVACFASLPDEPDTAEALAAWSRLKRVVLPRVDGDRMEFYEYDPAAMQRGAFGIAEPQAAAPCDPAQIDLIVVPGTAFTVSGGRMGRGRGYYDKYLSRPGFRARKIGVCYAHQLVEALPLEPHDVLLDEVIAE